VIGWLATILQAGPGIHGLLASADQVSYEVLAGDQDVSMRKHRVQDWDGPIVEVLWRGGPTAKAVADTLLTRMAPSGPVAAPDVTRPRENVTMADLTIGGVWVMLLSTDPDPDAQPYFVRDHPAWQWPDPISRDGVASAVVVWNHEPDGQRAEASVLHIPVSAEPGGDFLLHDESAVLPPGAGAARNNVRSTGWIDAKVVLRSADPGWGVDDARAWAENQLHRFRVGEGLVAVRMADEVRAVMRLSYGPGAPVLDIRAELAGRDDGILFMTNPPRPFGERQLQQMWAYLASAVFHGATRSTMTVPKALWVRPIGPLRHIMCRFNLEVTPIAATTVRPR